MKNKSETNKYSNQNFRLSAKKTEEASFFSSIGNILNNSGTVTGFMRECERK